MLRIVKTKLGTVEGIPAADPRITAFKSIPFAKPPVGELRFAPPQPAEPWEGIRECYKFPPIPVQPSPNRNPPPEDVYSREWDGERIARRGIVVVTVNYRVNLFGFTCHPELTAEYPENPANAGLQDQLAGLKWVYENVKAFGGDKDNITIGGQSAGAGSVLFHIGNPDSRKYFKRAVVDSGLIYAPNMPDMFPKRTITDAEKLGQEFIKFCGCNSLAEARKLTTDQLRKKWDEWGGYPKSIASWTPTFDDKFNRGSLIEVVQEGKCTPCPIFTGFTTDEFIFGGLHAVEMGIRKLMKEEEAHGIKLNNYCY